MEDLSAEDMRGKWVGGRCPGARLNLKCAGELAQAARKQGQLTEKKGYGSCSFKSETDTGAEIQRRAIIKVSP